MTSTVEERQLRWFNELKKKEAIGALLLVCHSRKWASQVAAGRPYPPPGSARPGIAPRPSHRNVAEGTAGPSPPGL